MDPIPPSRIGRYDVLRQLGVGGMGVVYLARDPQLGRTVAIKVLSKYNEELRTRFLREARSSAALQHNHIVTIYDLGEDEGRPFIAMEYVAGETMAEMIRRKAPVSDVKKLQLVIELCHGLGYAHRNQIIHRDIKPANLMITAEGVLKILDFGLARPATEVGNAGLTRIGVLLGTPQYMSPEQIKGSLVDLRSDIFAVGLTLYEILTYRKAFSGDPNTVLERIVNTEPMPIRELCPDIDPDLEQHIAKTIAKDPENRYQRLSLLAHDLDKVRNRLQSSSGDSTIQLKQPRPRTKDQPEAATPVSAPGPSPLLDGIAKRRAAQIQRHLDEAEKLLLAGQSDKAIEQCEAAAFIDSTDQRVLELLRRSCQVAEDQRVQAWLDEAQRQLSSGGLSEAGKLIEQALNLRPSMAEAMSLQRDLRQRHMEQERALEQARAVENALERARAQFGDGALEAAVRSAEEAIAYDPGNAEARELKERAVAALEEQRLQQEHEDRVFEAVAEGRRLSAAGQFQKALDLLRDVQPRHDLVDRTIAEITVLERRRLDQEAARQRAIAEERRQREELERRATEAVAAGRRLVDAGQLQDALELLRGFEPAAHPLVTQAIADVEAKVQAEIEARERQREEEAARQRALAEERRLQQEEAARQQVLEDERRRREEVDRSAAEAVAAGRRLVDAGQLQDALERLRGFEPAAHPLVTQAIADVEAKVQAEIEALERQRQEEAARQRALDAEQQRQREEEAARLRALDEERKRQQELERRVTEAVAESRRLADAGQLQDALNGLRTFEPAEPRVTQAIAEIEAKVEALERQQKEEQAARQRALEEERRRQKKIDQRATNVVAEARKIADAGRLEAALDRLRAFEPQHPLVNQAISEIDAQVAEIARRQQEEEAARQRALDEEARRRQAFEQRAAGAVADSRRLADAGKLQDALSLLSSFEPPHPDVSAALKDVRARATELEKQREEERQGREAVAAARSDFTSGRRADAIAQLERRPSLPFVKEALEELRGAIGAIDRATGNVERGDAAARRSALDRLATFTPPDLVAEALTALRNLDATRTAEEQERKRAEEQAAWEEDARLAVRQARAAFAAGRRGEALGSLGSFARPELVADSLRSLQQLAALVDRVEARVRTGSPDDRRAALAELTGNEEAELLGAALAGLRELDAARTAEERRLEEERRARAELEAEAGAANALAREAFVAGQVEDALGMLTSFREPTLVADALESLRRAAAEIASACAVVERDAAPARRAAIEKLGRLSPRDLYEHALGQLKDFDAERTAEEARIEAARLAREAERTSSEARQQFCGGQYEAAIAALERFESAPLVAAALKELQGARQAIDRARRAVEQGSDAERQKALDQIRRFAPADLVAKAAEELQQEHQRRREAEERERIERELRARAEAVARDARTAFDAGRADEAIASLEGFAPPHSVITDLLDDLRTGVKVREIVARAEESLGTGNLAEARAAIAEARRLRPNDSAADAVFQRIRAREREIRLQQVRKVLPYVAAVIVVAALSAGGYRLWTNRDQTVSPPPRTGTRVDVNLRYEGPPIKGPEAPPPAPVMAQLVIDALPWAEVVEVRSQDGQLIPIESGSETPLTLDVPVGYYKVKLRNGTVTHEEPVRIDAGTGGRAFKEFRKINAAEYFKRVGW